MGSFLVFLFQMYEFPEGSDSSLGFSSESDDVEMVPTDESKNVEIRKYSNQKYRSCFLNLRIDSILIFRIE